MLTRDEFRETEDRFFDATPYASDNEWNLDEPLRADDSSAKMACRAEAHRAKAGRIMVIGFGVIRV